MSESRFAKKLNPVVELVNTEMALDHVTITATGLVRIAIGLGLGKRLTQSKERSRKALGLRRSSSPASKNGTKYMLSSPLTSLSQSSPG